jgi:hypothetical protein
MLQTPVYGTSVIHPSFGLAWLARAPYPVRAKPFASLPEQLGREHLHPQRPSSLARYLYIGKDLPTYPLTCPARIYNMYLSRYLFCPKPLYIIHVCIYIAFVSPLPPKKNSTKKTFSGRLPPITCDTVLIINAHKTVLSKSHCQENFKQYIGRGYNDSLPS